MIAVPKPMGATDDSSLDVAMGDVTPQPPGHGRRGGGEGRGCPSNNW